MAIDNAELGKLVDDNEKTHNQLSELKAELEKVGENWTLFVDHLNQHPDTIRIEESKIVLKDEQHDDRILLKSELDIARVLSQLDEFQRASRRKQHLEMKLSEVGKGYIVDGLKNRKPPPATSLPN